MRSLTLPSEVTLTKSLAGASGYGKCPSRFSGSAGTFGVVAGLGTDGDAELVGAESC